MLPSKEGVEPCLMCGVELTLCWIKCRAISFFRWRRVDEGCRETGFDASADPIP